MPAPPPQVRPRQPSPGQFFSALKTLVLPWRAAAWLFEPRGRVVPDDPVMSWLGRSRATFGFVIFLLVAVRYGQLGKVLDLEYALHRWALTAGLAVPLLLVCMVALVLATRPGHRRAAARQMRWPVLSLTGFVATSAVALFWVGYGRVYFIGFLEVRNIHLPLADVGGPLTVWVGIFWIRSAYLIVRHWFNAADGHPLLPPLVATAVAWLTIVIDTVSEAADGVPPDVASFLAIGGAAVTTGLALAESWRLHRRYGISPRSGPWPQWLPPAPSHAPVHPFGQPGRW